MEALTRHMTVLLVPLKRVSQYLKNGVEYVVEVREDHVYKKTSCQAGMSIKLV